MAEDYSVPIPEEEVPTTSLPSENSEDDIFETQDEILSDPANVITPETNENVAEYTVQYYLDLVESEDPELFDLKNMSEGELDALVEEIKATLGDKGDLYEQTIRDQLNYLKEGAAGDLKDPSQLNTDFRADPVMMFNGQFVHQVNDIEIKGAGIDFVFQRTYKSQVFYIGPLGSNWNHNYNLHLQKREQKLILTTGDLKELTFTLHPVFNYYVPPDGELSIFMESGNTFTQQFLSGTKYLFTQDVNLPGLFELNRVEDRFGNYIKLNYLNRQIDTIEINNPVRKVKFNYDERGRIISVTDFTGRIWQYGYDDFNDLITVTTPATNIYKSGLTTRYFYSTQGVFGKLKHNILKIIDPNGDIYLENAYGDNAGLLSFNKVISQIQGKGQYLFEYETVYQEFATEYPDHQRPAFQTNFTDRNGHVVHFIYNKFGNLLLREEIVLDQNEFNYLATRYRYNIDGSLLATLSPEGVLTQYYYEREEYKRKFGIQDADIPFHPNLSAGDRLSFGNLLSTVKREKKLSIKDMNLVIGAWGDIFPDILGATDPNDRIIKYTYEPDYGQMLSASNPQFTDNADPNAVAIPFENANYQNTLTKFYYTGPPGNSNLLLSKIIKSSTTQADGTLLPSATEEFIKYDNNGRLLEHKDVNGIITELIYFDDTTGSKEGYIKEKIVGTGVLNLTTRYEVDTLGRIIKIRFPKSMNAIPGQHETLKEYNELDQVIKIISSAPFYFVTELFYNRNGKLYKKVYDAKDENGNDKTDAPSVSTFIYDEQLNLLEETYGGADMKKHLTKRYTYNCCDKLDIAILANGCKIKHYYDERMLEVWTTQGYQSLIAVTTKTVYNGDGLRKADISPKGHVTKFHYDTFGKVIKQEDALGNMILMSYDKSGNLIVTCFCEKKAIGYKLLSRSEYQYDEQNRKIKELYNLFDMAPQSNKPETDFLPSPGPGRQLIEQFYYDAKSRLIKKIDPMGFTTFYEYDGADRLISATDPYGNKMQNTFDENGNIIRIDQIESVKNDAGVEISKQFFSQEFEYDELDRKISQTDTLGNKTHFKYDSLNNLVKIIDPLGNIQRFTFDIYQRQIEQIVEMTKSGLGGGTTLPSSITQMEYDSNGNLIAVIDPNGNRTEEKFDELNRKVAVIYPDNSIAEINYDKDSNVAFTKDNNGLVRKNDLDELGRILKVTLDKTNLNPAFSIEGADYEIYNYDGLGRIISSENNFCINKYTFNSLGWLSENSSQFTTPLAPFNPVHVTKRKFNDDGIPVAVTYPSGRKISYDRDELNRLIKIKNLSNGNNYPGNNATLGIYDLASINYFGKLKSRQEYFGGAGTNYQYDKSGRLIQIDHFDSGANSFLKIQQLYDAINNMRFRNNISPALNSLNEFKYDSMYQVTKENKVLNNPPFNAVDFSPYTNIPPAPIPDQQALINNEIGNLSQPAALTLKYDLAGNREKEKLQGQPAVNYISNNLNQYSKVGVTNFSYDLNGNVIQSGARKFIYDSVNRLVRISDPALANDVLFFHDAEGKRILEISGAKKTHLIYNGLNVIEEYRNGNLYAQYAFDDGIDKPIQIASQNKERWYHTDLIGSVRALSNKAGNKTDSYEYSSFGILINSTGISYNPILFIGKRFDEFIEGYNSVTRYYYPIIGRFLQRDKAGIMDNVNLYLYTQNNPLTYTDILGTERENVFNLNLGNSANQLDPFYKLTDSEPLFAKQDSLAGIPIAGLGDIVGPITESMKTVVDTGSKWLNNGFNYARQLTYDFESKTRNITPFEWGLGASLVTGTAGIWFVSGIGAVAAGGFARAAAALGIGTGISLSPYTQRVLDAISYYRISQLASVLQNQFWGNKWRDVVANGYQQMGYLVETEMRILTPYGQRIMDVVVRNPKTNEILLMIETKAGNAIYSTMQITKDAWISAKLNVPILLERVPWSKPWFP